MALQRVSWVCCLLLVSLSPPRLALEDPEDVGEGTCAADGGGGKESVTCREEWTRQDGREGGGAVASVLGRRPQRLSVVDSADVHISVKTAAKYHEGRLSLLLLTWLQTLQPQQVHIVTDEGANDHWTATAEQFGFKVVTADGCSVGHCRECLCCKSGLEYHQFYSERENGSHYKWFCHVDDDVYVNIQQLVGVLRRYDPLIQRMYLGRWSLARTSKLRIERDIPNLRSREFAFGTGALYCISSCLMTELETLLRGSERFLSMCNLLQYTDDMTVGATIEAILGYNFTDVDLIFSELHATNHIPASELPSLISISYGKLTLPAGGGELKRHIKIPQPRFTLDEDPTRLLSFHCLLYPSTTWCI